MKKKSFKLLATLLAMLMLFSIVACKNEVQPEPAWEPDANVSIKYYMPNGWASKVTTPMWTTKDEGTVAVPDAILEGDGNTTVTNVTPELKAALAQALATPDYFKDVKNVIVIISDGMGITHVRASEQWSGELIMTQLPNIGASKTLTREGVYTDSAAGGTALSAGYKTTKLFAAMDAEGNDLKSMSELAREQGKLVGIVTNAEMADATPAVYSIHSKNRSQGWTKMCQMQVVFGADLFMGNGLEDYSSYFYNGSPLYQFTVDNNMKLSSSASNVVNNFSADSKMWAVFGGTANQFARFDTTTTKYPNLQQMTAYALAWLDAHDKDDQGFVVMIENTYTDHFGHGNDINELKKEGFKDPANTYGIVKEVQSTDEAVAIALKYVLEHPDTALIVTADHETGNTQLRPGWEEDFSLVKATSGDHSTQNVPVFAIGKGTEALNSLSASDRVAGKKWYEATPYENYKIGQVVGALLGDPSFGGDVNTDDSSKTSPEFDITVTTPSTTLTFTLDLMGAPISKNKVSIDSKGKEYNNSMIQFKIKPANITDRIKLELKKDDDTYESLFEEAVFSVAATKMVFNDKGQITTTFELDAKNNVVTPLSEACNQAFVTGSGLSEGWYQFSVPATADSTQIRITLTSAEDPFPAGTVIGMDDLTIQYGSTLGWLKFSSDNATAARPNGEEMYKYYKD